jgi:hypothetical protein
MPGPVSVTAQRSRASPSFHPEADDLQADLAVLGELDRVADQIGEHLANTQRIAEQVAGHIVRGADVQPEPLLGGQLAEQIQQAAQELLHVERRVLQLQLPRVDTALVEDVVQDAEQAAAGAQQLLQIAPGHGLQRAVQGQLGEPQDAVHRRADLVAHLREEPALGQGHGLGRLLGLAQLGFGAHAGGLVVDDREQQRPVADPDERGIHPNLAHLSRTQPV